jgi:hypothetical protein
MKINKLCQLIAKLMKDVKPHHAHPLSHSASIILNNDNPSSLSCAHASVFSLKVVKMGQGGPTRQLPTYNPRFKTTSFPTTRCTHAHVANLAVYNLDSRIFFSHVDLALWALCWIGVHNSFFWFPHLQSRGFCQAKCYMPTMKTLFARFTITL